MDETQTDKWFTWLDDTLEEWGYNIVNQVSGHYDGMELTRIFVICR
jgi:uncharacterized protein (UPF0297 family)